MDPVVTSRIVSLGTKLALATVVVLAIASTLLFYDLTSREWRGLLAAKTQAASMVSDLFAATVSAPVDFVDTDPEALQTEIGHLQTNPEVICAAVWGESKGKVLGKLDRGGCGAVSIPTDAELGGLRVLGDRVEVVRAVRSPANAALIGRVRLAFSLAYENKPPMPRAGVASSAALSCSRGLYGTSSHCHRTPPDRHAAGLPHPLQGRAAGGPLRLHRRAAASAPPYTADVLPVARVASPRRGTAVRAGRGPAGSSFAPHWGCAMKPAPTLRGHTRT